MQADRGCTTRRRPGTDLARAAGRRRFMVELAHNQAQTTLSYGGQYANQWPDGQNHTEPWQGPGNPPDCIQDDGALHTNNHSMAAGTAFAISYQSDISKVTMENLVVFSVAPK